MTGMYSGSAFSCPSLVHLRSGDEFVTLVELDKIRWARCFLWRGLLPALSGSNGGFSVGFLRMK